MEMTETSALRRALLELAPRAPEGAIEAERFGGRMSAGEVVQAATDNSRL